MSINLSTKTYDANRTLPDSVTYVGPANTLSNIDIVELKRVYPKAGTGTVKGVARPTHRIARDVVVNAVTGETATAYFNGALSLPVGITDAAVAALIADIVDLYQLEEAGILKVASRLDISY